MVVGELGHGGALAAGDDERVDGPRKIIINMIVVITNIYNQIQSNNWSSYSTL